MMSLFSGFKMGRFIILVQVGHGFTVSGSLIFRGFLVVSPNATDIITEGSYAVKYGFTIGDIISSSHIFPSLSEGIKLAAQSFLRDISKMSCCVE